MSSFVIPTPPPTPPPTRPVVLCARFPDELWNRRLKKHCPPRTAVGRVLPHRTSDILSIDNPAESAATTSMYAASPAPPEQEEVERVLHDDSMADLLGCTELLQIILSFVPSGECMRRVILTSSCWHRAMQNAEPTADTLGNIVSHRVGVARYCWAVVSDVRDDLGGLFAQLQHFEETLRKEWRHARRTLDEATSDGAVGRIVRECEMEFNTAEARLASAQDAFRSFTKHRSATDYVDAYRRIDEDDAFAVEQRVVMEATVMILGGKKRVKGVGCYQSFADFRAVLPTLTSAVCAQYEYREQSSPELVKALDRLLGDFHNKTNNTDLRALLRMQSADPLFIHLWEWVVSVHHCTSLFHNSHVQKRYQALMCPMERVEKTLARVQSAEQQLRAAPMASVIKQKQLLMQSMREEAQAIRDAADSRIEEIADLWYLSMERVEFCDQEAAVRRAIEREHQTFVTDKWQTLVKRRRSSALNALKTSLTGSGSFTTSWFQ